MARLLPILDARVPKAREKGIPTNCVTRRAPTR